MAAPSPSDRGDEHVPPAPPDHEGTDNNTTPEDDDDGIISDGDDDLDTDKKAWFLTRSRKVCYKTTACTFVIDMLPPEQRWAFLAVLLHTSDVIVRPIYLSFYVAIALCWYYPWIRTGMLVMALVNIDGFRRQGNDAMNNSASRSFDISTALAFFAAESGGETPDLASFIGQFLGAPEEWLYPLLPLLPGLCWKSPRDSINGFVPEGRSQGIVLALFSRACLAALPRAIHWTPFGLLAFPSLDYPHMIVEFLGCFVFWMWFDVNPQVAYAMYLFVNQWTHWTIQNKHRGARPPAILAKERAGTMWFALTSLIMRAIEFEYGPEILANGKLDLSVRVWLPLITILFLGIYLLRYGLGIRLHKFKHLPVKERDGIRLLRLRPQPRFGDSPIQCEIVHVRLTAPPPYVAVSHRWMDPKDGQDIILINEAPFLVSSSIHSFLLAKRSNFHNVNLWIDSICINQDDEIEKSTQVGMMRRIFEEATSTVGWLGDDAGATKAMVLAGRLTTVTSISDLKGLRRDHPDEWIELERMLSNSWFERVWIIQEVATSSNPMIRYGDVEVSWIGFAAAVLQVLKLSSQDPQQADPLCYMPGYITMAVMEHIRRQVDVVDFLKLRDMLKLAPSFESSLPVDKVYALLGITEERQVPLFHPKYSKTDTSDPRVLTAGQLAHDISSTLKQMAECLGTLSGESPTVRGSALMSNPRKSWRQLIMMSRDLSRLTSSLNRVGKRAKVPKRMMADYSMQTTPVVVYTVVAREMLRQGDLASILSHAGMSDKPSSDLRQMPSWVPDWSARLEACPLPHPEVPKRSNEDGTKGGITSDDEDTGADDLHSIVRDSGSNFLLLKSTRVGRITDLMPLTPFFEANKRIGELEDMFKLARRDFKRMSSNFSAALSLARARCRHYGGPEKYPSSQSIEDAFLRTTVADTSLVSAASASLEDLEARRQWFTGEKPDCTIKTALHALRSKSSVDDADIKTHIEVLDKYLFMRRMQSSGNARLAQTVLHDIAPSFATYTFGRRKDTLLTGLKYLDDQWAEERKKPQHRHQSIFDTYSGISNPLHTYDGYVDYTIGRKFAILEDGSMCLVPWGSQEGDFLASVPEVQRCVVFRNAVFSQKETDEDGDSEDEDNVDQAQEGKGVVVDGQSILSEDMCRFVGEAYVHGVSWDSPGKDGRWHAIW